MKLNTLVTNFALVSAVSLIAMPGFAADASTTNKEMGSTPQAVTPAEMAPPAPNTEGTTVPNAMGASDLPNQSTIDFGALDSNKDGSITMGEYLKYGGTSESFRQSDKNGDNKLDSSEMMTQ